MKVTPTAIPDVLRIEPKVFGDARGFFVETFQAARYAEAGIPGPFVQDNLSLSGADILRGLHLQHPNGQGKLVSALSGKILDVAVDVRVGSPTFGQHVAEVLDTETKAQLWIPPGFAHGFAVIEGPALFAYKCTQLYAPADEVTVLWNDPALGIDWPLGEPRLSDKDKNGTPLADIDPARPAPLRGAVSAPTLVFGAHGMLGRAWMALLTASGAEARGLDVPECDLTDPASVQKAVTGDAPLVVNCAAYTDVDGAETHEALATTINGDAVKNLVARCDEVGAKLVHYSTDYVFDGLATQPIPVDAPTAPLNAYGRSKLVGEEAILSATGPHLVVRTSWLYAPWGKNFVRTIARVAADKGALRVVDDQRGSPTSAEGLAARTRKLVEAGASGVHHGSDGGECTWFEFAKEIAKHAAPACTVDPCSSDEYPRPAPRPSYSVLDPSAADALVGPARPWQEHVASVLARMRD